MQGRGREGPWLLVWGEIKLNGKEAKVQPGTCCASEAHGSDGLSHWLIVIRYLFNITPTDTSIPSAHPTNKGQTHITEILQ